ncbi:MucR family transcriptional regulator [Acidisoma cellulosilytica]|uniref:MucR family transcriptional regulator n=1 Tax=Acidisoma cellulosilyticum TaxID=2802395 RepID=A0A963Z7Q0_9PROT|nr:MucR family transcriptional regulator [Acidisoma cellulosilyticum]MCB8884113.1 MucR family transcriptional regulator [Acidisoma cellulosilyticum]
MTISESELGAYVSNIVSAYVANHEVDTGGVPELIQSVYGVLKRLGSAPAGLTEPELVPAVPIKKSVFPDYIVCLEDGRKLKMLKRHLKSAYNMEPDEYRAKWGLPATYPIVAPNYAEKRSGLAKQNKLGHKATVEPQALVEPEPVVQKIPARRRGKKVPGAEGAR